MGEGWDTHQLVSGRPARAELDREGADQAEHPTGCAHDGRRSVTAAGRTAHGLQKSMSHDREQRNRGQPALHGTSTKPQSPSHAHVVCAGSADFHFPALASPPAHGGPQQGGQGASGGAE